MISNSDLDAYIHECEEHVKEGWVCFGTDEWLNCQEARDDWEGATERDKEPPLWCEQCAWWVGLKSIIEEVQASRSELAETKATLAEGWELLDLVMSRALWTPDTYNTTVTKDMLDMVRAFLARVVGDGDELGQELRGVYQRTRADRVRLHCSPSGRWYAWARRKHMMLCGTLCQSPSSALSDLLERHDKDEWRLLLEEETGD